MKLPTSKKEEASFFSTRTTKSVGIIATTVLTVVAARYTYNNIRALMADSAPDIKDAQNTIIMEEVNNG